MDRLKKRTAHERKHSRKSTRRRNVSPTSSVALGTSSSPITVQSDPAIVNSQQDEISQLTQFTKTVGTFKENLDGSKTSAKEFEVHAQQYRMEVVAKMKEHEVMMEGAKGDFQKAFLAIVLSALTPMFSSVAPEQQTQAAESRINLSALDIDESIMYKYSEVLCKTTTEILCMSATLNGRETRPQRIAKARNRMVEDEATNARWITAGAKKAKMELQTSMGEGRHKIDPVLKMSDEEEADARSFSELGGDTLHAAETGTVHWNEVARALVNAAEAIETLSGSDAG